MPIGRGKRKRRLVRKGETYTADMDDIELEPVEEDPALVPEAEQVGELDHEGGPDDGGN
jgi:hypothetical protein